MPISSAVLMSLLFLVVRQMKFLNFRYGGRCFLLICYSSITIAFHHISTTSSLHFVHIAKTFIAFF